MLGDDFDQYRLVSDGPDPVELTDGGEHLVAFMFDWPFN